MFGSRFRLFLVGAVVTAGFLVGASPASANSDSSPQKIAFTTTVTSTERVIYNAGVNNSITYGWNRLIGTATIDGVLSDIELLGNVDYKDNGGPFYGFITITQPDATLALRMNGKAVPFTHRESYASTPETRFKSKLKVLGGSGRFIEARGAGAWTGERTTELGGAVSMRVVLKVSGISD